MINNDDFLYAAECLTRADYAFAKTMPKHPHHYTLRKDWNDEDFVKTVEIMRQYGYPEHFYRKQFIRFNVNQYKYWTMGEPINKDGQPWTILINRAKRFQPAEYDRIADKYDSLFRNANFRKEDQEVMEMIGWKSGEKVLDIGCGTGLFLEFNNAKPDEYLGIDKSSRMLEVANRKFPEAKFINTEFEYFYSAQKFDKIVALYGTASYVTPECLGRITHFLNDNGKAFLMFYKDSYHPLTYEKTGVELSRYSVLESHLDGTAKEYHNYVIVELRK